MFIALAFALALQSPGQEVAFRGAGDFELKGTLTVPAKTSGPAPAVLLLPGSGPSDRNANQPPQLITDVLKQIAERLADEGFVTLRFDKRAVHAYASQWPKDLPALNDFFSWENFVADAKAGLDFLRSRPQVDPKRAFILGHSEGGMIAVQIAGDTSGRTDAPYGLVLVATPGRTMDQLIREQVAGSLARAGIVDSMAKPYTDYVDAAIRQIKKDGTVPPDPPPGLGPLFPPSALKLLRAYFTVEPARLASKFAGPVLVVQGEKDIQVSPIRDAPPLMEALKARGKGSAELFIVPSASHNLKSVGDPNKEPAFAGPIVPEAMNKIVDWLQKQSRA